MPVNRKESALITGANGFVGSRLCYHLLNNGYHVIAGIRKGCDISLIKDLNLEFRYGDITQPETLPEMVYDVDYIIHNAGLVKTDNTDNFKKVNREGARNMAEAATGNTRLKKFIFISSVAAVGPSPINRPLTEDDRPHPITAYGRSKLAGEEEILGFKDKINTVIIRPPAIYGPGDKEMYSFFRIIHYRIKPYLGNLNRQIQLVHVDDLCESILRVIQTETKSASVYFIAESKSYSFRRLVYYLEKAVGRIGFPLYIPGIFLKLIAAVSESVMKIIGKSPMFTTEKADEILSNWEISTEKAEKELGFFSKIAFPDGAKETVRWYRKEGWL